MVVRGPGVQDSSRVRGPLAGIAPWQLGLVGAASPLYQARHCGEEEDVEMWLLFLLNVWLKVPAGRIEWG